MPAAKVAKERMSERLVTAGKIKTRAWSAWNNKMPPPPDDVHVIGEVYVSNPGVEPRLRLHQPQGINKTILLLDLYLYQKPGIWPQVFVWAKTRYDAIAKPSRYKQAQIIFGGATIATMPVKDVF